MMRVRYMTVYRRKRIGNVWYKKNPIFIRQAVLMIFRRNYGIYIDAHEIDTSISIGENVSLLCDKYVYFRYKE